MNCRYQVVLSGDYDNANEPAGHGMRGHFTTSHPNSARYIERLYFEVDRIVLPTGEHTKKHGWSVHCTAVQAEIISN